MDMGRRGVTGESNMQSAKRIKTILGREFPAGLVVRIWMCTTAAGVQTLGWEPRSHIKPLHSMAKTKQNKKRS